MSSKAITTAALFAATTCAHSGQFSMDEAKEIAKAKGFMD